MPARPCCLPVTDPADAYPQEAAGQPKRILAEPLGSVKAQAPNFEDDDWSAEVDDLPDGIFPKREGCSIGGPDQHHIHPQPANDVVEAFTPFKQILNPATPANKPPKPQSVDISSNDLAPDLGTMNVKPKEHEQNMRVHGLQEEELQHEICVAPTVEHYLECGILDCNVPFWPAFLYKGVIKGLGRKDMPPMHLQTTAFIPFFHPLPVTLEILGCLHAEGLGLLSPDSQKSSRQGASRQGWHLGTCPSDWHLPRAIPDSLRGPP
ncbi:hypothetical protein WJX84_002584 [Apatococcus fuscideae]|uniref:Uncharacterized protein n=1 Tax=Apatococcus fuscideae TaxID=2026836 RepID=A0AAW1SV76_9CHLO